MSGPYLKLLHIYLIQNPASLDEKPLAFVGCFFFFYHHVYLPAQLVRGVTLSHLLGQTLVKLFFSSPTAPACGTHNIKSKTQVGFNISILGSSSADAPASRHAVAKKLQ